MSLVKHEPSSVCLGTLDAVDDERTTGCFGWNEAQAKLLLNGGEYRRAIRALQADATHFWRPLQRDIVAIPQSGAIQDWQCDDRPQRKRQLISSYRSTS